MSDHDDLPPALVAAIGALIAAMPDSDDQPEEDHLWTRSGRVAPSWNERGKHAWRDGERERGWQS